MITDMATIVFEPVIDKSNYFCFTTVDIIAILHAHPEVSC